MREPEEQVLKEGGIDEEAVMMSSHLLVVKWRGRAHLSRTHARWAGPVRQRNQSLDGAMKRRNSKLDGLSGE